MSRYVQKISLRPYSDGVIWTGWELEGKSGPIDGLLLVDDLSDAEIAARYQVTEFQKIPAGYVDGDDVLPKA